MPGMACKNLFLVQEGILFNIVVSYLKLLTLSLLVRYKVHPFNLRRIKGLLSTVPDSGQKKTLLGGKKKKTGEMQNLEKKNDYRQQMYSYSGYTNRLIWLKAKIKHV